MQNSNYFDLVYLPRSLFPETSLTHIVKKPRVATRNVISFCVKRSRLALSRLLCTSSNSFVKASFSCCCFSGGCVLIKWSLYAVKLDSLASIKLNIGLITAQWFWGAPNSKRLNSVAVKLENKFGWAFKCWWWSKRYYSRRLEICEQLNGCIGLQFR